MSTYTNGVGRSDFNNFRINGKGYVVTSHKTSQLLNRKCPFPEMRFIYHGTLTLLNERMKKKMLLLKSLQLMLEKLQNAYKNVQNT